MARTHSYSKVLCAYTHVRVCVPSISYTCKCDRERERRSFMPLLYAEREGRKASVWIQTPSSVLAWFLSWTRKAHGVVGCYEKMWRWIKLLQGYTTSTLYSCTLRTQTLYIERSAKKRSLCNQNKNEWTCKKRESWFLVTNLNARIRTAKQPPR